MEDILFPKRCEQGQGPGFFQVITQLKFLFCSGGFYQSRASIQGCSHQDETPARCLSNYLLQKQRARLMAKTNLPLRTELDGVWYFESHPQVAEFFKSAEVFDYCERLTSFIQPLAEAFARSYNGRTVNFGREEFHVDEAAISECTGLPRIGQSWFKTTKASDIEFRSYLLPAHKEIIWKRIFPSPFLNLNGRLF